MGLLALAPVVGWRGPRSGTSFGQLWNFSPTGSTREAKDYRGDLSDVTALELTIVPDVSGGATRASLAQWRVA
jgi:hypothetical protein